MTKESFLVEYQLIKSDSLLTVFKAALKKRMIDLGIRLTLLSISLILIIPYAAAEDAPNKILLSIQRSKPDTERISLQLKMATYYLTKSDRLKSDLDSAYNFLNQAAQLSHKLHVLEWEYKTQMLIGNYYAKAGDLERCKQYFMQAIKNYQKTGENIKQAGSWAQLGDMFENDGKNDHNDERIAFYQHARVLYLKAHQPINETHLLAKIAEIQIDDQQYDQAEENLLQALAYFKKLHYKNLQNIYERLAAVQYLKNNYYRAMTYASEGIKTAESLGDTAMASTLYEEIARYNYIVKNYSEALQWLRKAMALDTGKYIYKCQLVSALLALNKTEDARVALNIASKDQATQPDWNKALLYKVTALYYNKIDKTDLALQYYHKILQPDFRKRFDKISFNYWAVICNNDIAGIYLKTNHAEKAKKYLDDAALLFQNTKKPDLRYLADFYSHSYKYNLAIGNYRSAVKNLEQRDRLEDSLFTVNKDNKFAELVVQYETIQKEQSIKNLHNQASAQQAKLQAANLQRNITIGGVLVMIVISSLLYKYYKQKKSANEIITRKNNLLQDLLKEKEWLLKEVHHRVKNNLHTVICLLESQARYLENDALTAIENSQHRIYAMSLIHQKLYQSDDIKTINMAAYIPELVQSLEDSFGTAGQIRFKLDIEPINLSLSHAIPLGLIINEAVTNSFKYAFPGYRKGEISILMTDDGKQTILELADNGIGMPEIDFDDEPDSLGLRLIKGLSEDIDAEINFEINNGTRIIITFKSDLLNNPDGILKSTKTTEVYI